MLTRKLSGTLSGTLGLGLNAFGLGTFKLAILGVGAMFWVDRAMAQDESFRVSAEVDLRRVSNANLVSDANNAVDEIQSQASLLMLGGLRWRLVDFETDYALNGRTYSEYSERNENLLLGHSSFRVGTEGRRHYLELSHSSAEIAIDPQLSDLPGNRDTRTVVTANAFTSARVGPSSLISLQLNTSDFEFKENLASEASNVGYGTSYTRQVSPLYQLGLSASGYQLDYRYVDETLDYRQLSAFWRAELRRSHYSVTVGSNTMKRLNESESSPLVEATWGYKMGAQTLSASVAQKLSDTSHGGGSTVASNRPVGVDGRGQVRDQFKLTSADLNWRHERLCSRCSLDIAVGVQEEEYVQFSQFSSRQTSLRVGTVYRLNSTINVQLDADLGTYKAIDKTIDKTMDFSENSDYQFSQVAVSASFPGLIRDGSAAVFVGVLERNFEHISGYTSNFIGARFRYLLVDR